MQLHFWDHFDSMLNTDSSVVSSASISSQEVEPVGSSIVRIWNPKRFRTVSVKMGETFKSKLSSFYMNAHRSYSCLYVKRVDKYVPAASYFVQRSCRFCRRCWGVAPRGIMAYSHPHMLVGVLFLKKTERFWFRQTILYSAALFRGRLGPCGAERNVLIFIWWLLASSDQ